MKNTLPILLLILIGGNIYGQSISPYFPSRYISATSNEYETQITYFDLNFVNLKLQDYLSYQFGMTLNSEKAKYELKNGKGFITSAFVDKISMNRNPRELFFKFNVFPMGKEFVIKDLKITGTTDAVLRFYVSYWTTTLNFDDISKTEIVSNRLLQDRISYNFNNGNPYIKIENTTIESPEKFIDEYQRKKNANAKKEKEKDEKAKKEKIKAKREKERNTKVIKFTYQVVKKRRGLEFIQNSYFPDNNAEKANIEKKFNELLSNKERGEYLIEVNYTEVYDKLKNTELEIKSYKPKGFFGALKEVIED